MEKVLTILFLISLPIGEMARIQIGAITLPRVHELILFFLVVYELIKNRETLVALVKKEPVAKGILLFIVVGVLSLLINVFKLTSEEFVASSLYLLRWSAYSGLVFVALGNQVQRTWLLGLYVVGVVFALVGFFQVVLYPYLRNLMYLGWDPHRFRLFSTLLDPNFMGIILVIAFLLGLGLWQQTKFRQHLFIIGEAVLLTATYLTYSRSAYLALVVGFVIWLWLQKKLGRLGIIGILIFLLAVFFVPRPGGETLRLDRWDSTMARIGNWQESITLFERSPVFGLGFDTLRFVTRNNDTFDPDSHAAGGLDNSFFFVFVTTGVVGAAIYGYLLYQMIDMGMKLLKDRKTRWFGAGYLAMLASIGVDSLFIHSQFYPWVMVYMFVLTGVGLRIQKKRTLF